MSGFLTCRDLFYGRSSVMMIAWLALIAILMIPVESGKQTVETKPNRTVKPWENSRLPKNVVPRHYTITVKPEFYTKEETSFTGSVKIEMEVINKTNLIILHIKDINITRYRLVFNDTNKVVPTKKPFPYRKNDFWVLPVASELSEGFYRLELSYTGKTHSYLGILKYKYIDPETNRTRYVVITAHYPVGARWTFPCFDEPAMKAQFTVKIIHKNTDGYFALSNMPQESTEMYKESGYNITTFARSVLMSTFTVSFSVNDFVHKKAVTKGNVELRVFLPRQQENQLTNLTDTVLETSVKALEFFGDYFGIPYPLPKLDNIVIPAFERYLSGSWGLMAFDSTALPYNKTFESQTEFPKFRVPFLISRRIAQQWFGNLVTMDRWSDAWFKFGFAYFFELKAAEFINPSLKKNSFLMLWVKDRVMRKDSYKTSVPGRKAGYMLYILEDLLGKNKFKLGLQKFVKKFKFSNANTSQFWEVLSQVSGQLPYPLSAIMIAWFQRKGFPVISISDANPPAISQEWRRIYDKVNDTTVETSDFKWLLKLDYKSSGIPKQGSMWINGTDKFTLPINVKLSKNDSWILLNAGIGYGYYRVNYPVSFWKRIPMLIKKDMPTTPFERATLLTDAFYFASVGDLSYEVLLPMLEMLKNEKNFMVWSRVVEDIAYLMKRFQGLPFEKKMKKYFRGIVTNIFADIPMREPTTRYEHGFQLKVTPVVCATGIPRCPKDMLRLFNRYKKGKKTPVPLLRPMLRYGWLENMDSKYNWLSFEQAYKKPKHLDSQLAYQDALFSSDNATFIERILQSALNSSDFYNLMIKAPSTKTWQWLTYWRFISENWNEISTANEFANKTSTQARILRIATKYLNTESQLQQLKGIVKRNPLPEADSIVKRVKTKLRWIKSRGQAISAWLNANVVD